MAQLIKMPAVAADNATGSLARWLKRIGDSVAVGDPIAEIETDKAIVEITADHAGVVARILAPAGAAQLPVNAILGVLIAEGEGDDAIAHALAESGAVDVTCASSPSGKATVQASQEGSLNQAHAKPEPATRRFSSPAARRIAAEHQIDLSQIDGSGPRGRILKDDVQRAAQALAADAPRNAHVSTQDDTAQSHRTPHSNMRRTIARRLTESKQTIPHFYLTRDCRVDALLALRQEIMADGQVRISVNDFVVRAAALALIEVPQVNVAWEDDALVHHSSADIAVAVATEGGLVTPIVRRVESKTLSQVATEIAALAARGREQRLKPAEYTGGSMTVSNLGMYGVTAFAAIINPPQAAILAVGAAEKRPTVDADGALHVATMMTVTLSVDHRAVDGAVAAAWLAAFNRLIEQPLRILL